jgi:ribonuclease P protein component
VADARFPRRVRLLKKADFDRVFKQAAKSGDRFFTVLYVPNDLGYARLGLAVSRKSARSAVVRNRIKRMIRENFRLSQHDLPSLDIVVITRPQLAQQDKTALLSSIKKHWGRLMRVATNTL